MNEGRPSWAMRLQDFFGAHRVLQRTEHERDRALQRTVFGAAVSGYWAIHFGWDPASSPSRFAFPALIAFLACASLAYRYRLGRSPGGAVGAMYFFLVADPVLLVGILVYDARSFAFLNPFLLIVIVRSGIRYGARTMWLEWALALVAAAVLLPQSAYWRSDIELTLSFMLLLGLLPLFFVSMIRRIHEIQAFDEERVRLAAKQEIVVARSMFLSKVGHELRSPLQTIVSALDVFQMRQTQAHASDDELIDRMRRSSLLLNTQLRDLLTLAKGETGRLALHPEPFDACALLDGVAAGARELAASKGLELIVELPAEAVFVVADGARIDQVLTNLVINSIKYTEVGQVRLTLREPLPASSQLRISVADTGPGIPREVLPTLLAPDRVSTGTERRGEGSGIGLAIVRTLVEHLGGTISVTSVAGRGTTFALQIPAESIDAVSIDRSADDPTGRVLVVDDRADMLDAIASVVDELGFECDRAASAAIGANLLAARRYDLVLVDIEMPVKGGAELASETRLGSGPNRATRFVGMSAADIDEGTSRRFDACLAKPIDHKALRRVLFGPGHEPTRPSQPGLWLEP